MNTSLERDLTVVARIVSCPDPHCAAPAYIADPWNCESTAEPGGTVEIRCLAGCRHTVAAADIGS
jgi:hypothetical protein